MHELEETNGEYNMVWVGEVPWHGLGKKIRSDLTPEQVLQEAGLDWEVEKYDTFFEVNGEQYPTKQKALVRSTDKKVLTHVSGSWKPTQNREAFEFFNEYVMAGDMEMHTAGSLKGGQIVWALAKVKESFELVTPQGKDLVESFLLFSNPHQFGRATDVKFTPTRVVCWNTLSFALDQTTTFSAKQNHSKKFDAEKVKETLKIANLYMNQYKDVAEFLVDKRYTNESLLQFFKTVFPKTTSTEEGEISRNAETALKVIEQQPGANLAAGSWWSAYNTVTFMTDHLLGRNSSTRMESAWYGANQRKKLTALNVAKKMAMA